LSETVLAASGTVRDKRQFGAKNWANISQRQAAAGGLSLILGEITRKKNA
jgi:hypothetical protein